MQTVFAKASKNTKPDCVKNAIGCLMVKGWAGELDGTLDGALEVASKILGKAEFGNGEVVAVEQYKNGELTDYYMFESPVFVTAIGPRGKIY